MKNNTIYKKVTIANDLKQFEVKEVFELAGMPVSSSTVKGFSAGSQNKNHIKLSDEQLEAFFNGLILYWRGAKDENDMVPRGFENYILNLMKSGNRDILEELGCLIDDAKDGIQTGCEEDGEDDDCNKGEKPTE
jgi:hypothetical protein